VIWQKPASQIEPDVGAASSPLGDRDLVIAQEGYETLTAFEANTGTPRWSVKNDFRYASPVIADLHGMRQVIAHAQHAVLGISVADGAILWEHPWKSPYVQAITPVVNGETIIVSGHQRGVMALKPIRRENSWRVEVLWETQDVSMYLSNPVIIDETLFGLSHRNSGQFFALDASTGRVLWLDRPRRASNSAVVKAEDLVFYLNDDAELLVARSNRTRFELLRRYSVANSATWAQPAISGTRIFIKDVSSLALWSLQ
jgi:outer membrane protein assembly factor BamB